MSDEAIALGILLSTMERMAVSGEQAAAALERIADLLDDHTQYFEAANAPDPDTA
jgi:hypothetical protein